MKCGKIYGDDAEELLTGCSECGYKLFLYVDEEEKAEEKFEQEDEREEERKNILRGIENFIRDVKDDVDVKFNRKVEFDLESIRVMEDGVYEINLTKLLNEIPLIVEIKEGKYYVHLASIFTKGKEKSLDIEDLG
ncbi:MAG: Zn-ribbon domain-containing protein [Candidatus Aenigmatarchaeota archaeon]